MTDTTSICKQPSTLLFASGKHPRKNNIMHNVFDHHNRKGRKHPRKNNIMHNVFDHHNRKGRITNAMIINHAGWSASHEESVYH